MNATGQPETSRAEPFDAIAEEYDERFTNSIIGKAQRASVWQEMDRLFRSGQHVLDINCGTGVDAVHLSSRGIQVTGCDASTAMIAVARRRLDAFPNRNQVDFRVLTIEQIGNLEMDDLFDGVLSNFAGLNCVADLQSVARDLARLVRPGGHLILCLFGRFCLWEIFWYALQVNAKKAFRRFRGKGAVAQLGPGHSVFVRYPSVRSLRRDFASHFRLLSWKGAGIVVPPSYLEPWARQLSPLFKFAARIDPFLGRLPGLRALADHVVVVLERKEA